MDAWRNVLWQQFGATLDMFEDSVNACPAKLWETKAPTRPFGYWVYHTLFFLDFYLSDAARDFSPPTPFGLSELNREGEQPERIFTKTELLDYLQHCRQKCQRKIASLTDETAHQLSAVRSRQLSVAELLLYNLRHVQHHIGHLNTILRQRTDSAPVWVGRARNS